MSRGRFGRARILVDSSAFAALAIESDSDHAAARAAQGLLSTGRWEACSTNFVIAETHALLLRRAGRDLALRIIQQIVRDDMLIVRVTEDDERRALAIMTQYDDKDFSYTDATSFVVMERLQIDTAFTFDRHFIQYGFRTLTADQA